MPRGDLTVKVQDKSDSTFVCVVCLFILFVQCMLLPHNAVVVGCAMGLFRGTGNNCDGRLIEWLPLKPIMADKAAKAMDAPKGSTWKHTRQK